VQKVRRYVPNFCCQFLKQTNLVGFAFYWELYHGKFILHAVPLVIIYAQIMPLEYFGCLKKMKQMIMPR
jgi:hypothetical protein